MPKKKIIKKTLYKTIKVLDFIVEALIAVPEAFIGKDVVYKGCKSIFSSTISSDNINYVISKNLSELKRYGYIIENKNESLVLTNRAKLKYIDKLSEQSIDDGKFRFISYDIPETLRLKRDRFRRSIKLMGFIKIQKSLWVTDRNVVDLLETVIEEHEVEDYIIYMVSDRSNVDKMLKVFLNPRLEKELTVKKKLQKTSLIKLKNSLDFSEFRKNIRW